jgi:hypothetical protein
MAVSISKATQDSWVVRPYFTAFPAPLQLQPKNIIFLLDTSGSMREKSRLQKVKVAVSNLLDKLKPTDTFSVVSFNDTATHLVTSKHASKREIATAKSQIDKMGASSGTSFRAAFSAVNKSSMIPSGSHSSIIFLTDGEDKSCDAKTLFKIFKGKKFLHIIPVGILAQTSSLLDALATLSGGGSCALYIKDDHSTDYQKAFDTAFQRAAEANKCDDSLDGKQVAPPATYRGSLGFFPKVLTGAVLAGCGATAGYYGGNVLVTANVVNAVLATGISPFLFMSGCAVASAIALPLLVYGCVQMGMQPLTESSSLAMC